MLELYQAHDDISLYLAQITLLHIHHLHRCWAYKLWSWRAPHKRCIPYSKIIPLTAYTPWSTCVFLSKFVPHLPICFTCNKSELENLFVVYSPGANNVSLPTSNKLTWHCTRIVLKTSAKIFLALDSQELDFQCMLLPSTVSTSIIYLVNYPSGAAEQGTDLHYRKLINLMGFMCFS